MLFEINYICCPMSHFSIAKNLTILLILFRFVTFVIQTYTFYFFAVFVFFFMNINFRSNSA